MDLAEILRILFYDDTLTRHLKRAGKAGRKVAQPATKPKRVARIGAALSAAGDVVSTAGERAAQRQRAERRSKLLKLTLVGGAAAGAAVAAQQRKSAMAARKTEPATVPRPQAPAEAVHA